MNSSSKILNLIIKHGYVIVWSVEKKTDSENPRVIKTNKGRLMILSKWAMYDSKKSKFIKEKEVVDYWVV